MQVTIIDVSVVDKGKWKYAEVAFKGPDGKMASKRVVSFGATEGAFKYLTDDTNPIAKGEIIEVKSEKNANGYWDWISCGRPSAAAVASGTITQAVGKSVPKSNYETSEERAARQVMIVRQSSLSNAVAHLNHVKKAYEVAEVIQVARQFEAYVLDTAIVSPTTSKSISDMQDDVPY